MTYLINQIINGKTLKKHLKSSTHVNKCPNSFKFLDLCELEMMNSWKSWKVEDEESPDINFAGGISPKAWIWI